MIYPPITNLIEKTNSRYSLVIAVAKRAREIAEKLPEDSKEKPVLLAVEDFKEQIQNVVIDILKCETQNFKSFS